MNIATRTSRDFDNPAVPLIGIALVIIGVIYVVVVGPIKLAAHLGILALQPSFLATVSLIFIALGVAFGLVGYEKLSGMSGIASVPFISLYGIFSFIESIADRKSRKAGRA